MNNHDLPKSYEIEGVLYPASYGFEWASMDKTYGLVEIDGQSFTKGLTPATTELDRYCLKMYGSMFDKICTETQRTLLFLHEKGGLRV